MPIFYKGTVTATVDDRFVPGSVTTDIRKALVWKERLESKKTKGAARHVTKGKSCVVMFSYEGELNDHSEFQRPGVSEHDRGNCWMAADKTQAQINTKVRNVRILTNAEVESTIQRLNQKHLF